MCRPETRQSYFVLQAYANASTYIGQSALREILKKVAVDNGYQGIEHVGPETVGALVTSLARGGALHRNANGLLCITEEGRFQLNLLKNMSKKPSLTPM